MRLRNQFPLLIATCLVACVSSASAQVTTDDIRQGARERVQGSLAEQEERAYALSLLVQFESRLKQTNVLLDELEIRAQDFEERCESLMTSGEGKRLALAGDKIAVHFITLQEQPVVEQSELAAKKTYVDGMLSFLEKAKVSRSGYVPQPNRVQEADEAYLWARGRVARVAESEAWLEHALKNADQDTDVSADPTLEERIRGYLAARRELWAEQLAKGAVSGQREALPKIEENARIAELERALQQSDLQLRQARQELEQQRIDFQLRLEEQTVQLQERLAASQREMDERLAAIERENQIAEAERRRRDAQAGAEARRIGDDAERIALVAKCKSPSVQTDLAPFLASGTWQPGDAHPNMRVDSTPMSLSKLRAFGALDEDMDGIKNMLNVANNLGCTPKANGPNGLRGNAHIDTSRPKWGYPRSFHKLSADDIAEVRRIQALLIELGPTLVEEGMLAK